MDFRCLWHPPAYILKRNEERRFANKLTLYVQWIGRINNLQNLRIIALFLLTFWLTTLVDRPVTSALHMAVYFIPFTTWIRHHIPGFDRWDSLWMKLGFGQLKDSQTAWTRCRDALVDEAFERPRDFINLSPTTSICIAQLLTVARAQFVLWRDLPYIMTRDWKGQTLVIKRTHLLYTGVYCWLDTLQQGGFDDER